MNRPESHYIHGTAADEQRRLSILNDLINEASLRELALHGGEKILDVGSGLGQFTRAMARAAGPIGRVIGIERDPPQMAEALRQARDANEENLVELRVGDALALPLRAEEWGTFDAAHTRFVLEHVPDPLAVVQAMVRSVRPGGRIVLEDDDHDVIRLWPDVPEFRAVWQAYLRTYALLGNDAFIGRKLVALLHEAGAMPVRSTWIFFGSCSGHPTFDALVRNMIGILQGAREMILTQALLDPGPFDSAIAAVDAWRGRADAALWYAVCWAEGMR